MKKILTLLAMVLMAVGTSAQEVIAEIDWTRIQPPTPYLESSIGANVTVVEGIGLIVETSNLESQVPIIGIIPKINSYFRYQIMFTLNSLEADELQLKFSDGNAESESIVIDIDEGEKEYTVDFLNYTPSITNALLICQFGKTACKYIIKRVQIKEMYPIVVPTGSLDLCYNYLDNNEAEVIKNRNKKYSKIIDIPSTVHHEGKDYNVTKIADDAFEGCKNLTSITIPNSVKVIGRQAFANCSGLTSIEIPNSVDSIGNLAFVSCTGLSSIILPNNITSIGVSVFARCSGLTSITIPNSVTSIGYDAFYGCSGLTSINLPNSVTSIFGGAFCGCSGLTSITIPNIVTYIGYRAFEGCSGLTSIKISKSVAYIEGYFFGGVLDKNIYNFNFDNNLNFITVDNDNLVYDSRNKCNAIIESETNRLILGCSNTIIPKSVTCIAILAFANCKSLNFIEIPNSVKIIGAYAFWNCSGLTSIEIPNSVDSIGGGAFNGTNLTTVVSRIENPFPINGCCSVDDYGSYNGSFNENTFKYATLYVPVGSIEKYKSTDGWKDFVYIKEKDFTDISTLKIIDKVTEKTRYTIDGKIISQPQRGLNIIRMSDGTTKKVLVK